MVAVATPSRAANFPLPLVPILPFPGKEYTAIITAWYEDTSDSDTLVIDFKTHDDAAAIEYAENHAAIIREHGYFYPASDGSYVGPTVPDVVTVIMVARAPLVYLFDRCFINPLLAL